MMSTCNTRLISTAIATTLFASVGLLASSAVAQVMPTDASPTCVVGAAEINGWFEGNAPTLDAVAKPADSLVALTPNCGFFKWSEQMFLWLTSPAPASYGGGGGRIFASPAFYDVTPPRVNGTRTLLPHSAGLPFKMQLRAAKTGPHGLPLVKSKSGTFFEVARPDPKNPVRPFIRAASGNLVEVTQIKVLPAGVVNFLDVKGAVVAPQKLVEPVVVRPMVRMANKRMMMATPVSTIATAQIARKFILNGRPIFIDRFNHVIDVEQGQSDSGILMTQNGSLVYYLTVVNDVYAYQRTMLGNNAAGVAAASFPTTQAGLNTVVAFAASHNKTFPDPNALAIESKSSWVEATAVPDPSQYVTVTATIPTYNTSNPLQWVPNGQKTVKLVLIGMHVVGSTSGHPEMVWSTFEHLGNAPSAHYTYTSTTGPKTIAQDTSGTWLFTAANAGVPFNSMHMSWDGSKIVAISPFTISASNTLRAKPWGSADPTSTPANASTNTQVIAINASVRGQLAPTDVRKNYFMLGATWTISGAPANGSNGVGTGHLANATIETYTQGTDATAAGSINCFACHNGNQTPVSHIFAAIKPLF